MFTSFGRRPDPNGVRGRSANGRFAGGAGALEAVGQVPTRFEAVAEALAEGGDVSVACAVVGRDLARDGAGLGEALDGLRSTFVTVCGRAPDFVATEALSLAWSDATLEYLHQLSCEDPMTGLASQAHLRSRLTETYRGASVRGESTTASHALVVVALPAISDPGPGALSRAFRRMHVAQSVRTVFAGEETVAQVGESCVVVLVTRSRSLGRDVAALRTLLHDVGLSDAAERDRIWIEGLPARDDAAGLLLDELARL